MREEKKQNIPGGSLGPRKLLWVESCHGIRLKGHTLGLDASHWVLNENGKSLWNLLLVEYGAFCRFCCRPMPAAAVEYKCRIEGP